MADITLIGILSGVGASILLALVVLLTLNDDKVTYYTTGRPLFFILLLLMCIQIAQMIFSWIIITYWEQSPKQTESTPLVT